MNKALVLSLVLWTACAHAAIDSPSGRYGIDSGHAYITFSYSHLGFSNPHVGFNEFDVQLELDADHPERSKLRVTIQAASIDSRVDEFDEHLKGERFFDVANFPVITFVATKIEMSSDATAKITGELTIKGITKTIELNASLNKAAMHPMLKKPVLGISAVGQLSRSDFGFSYAVPMVGDEVNLFVSAELPLIE